MSASTLFSTLVSPSMTSKTNKTSTKRSSKAESITAFSTTCAFDDALNTPLLSNTSEFTPTRASFSAPSSSSVVQSSSKRNSFSARLPPQQKNKRQHSSDEESRRTKNGRGAGLVAVGEDGSLSVLGADLEADLEEGTDFTLKSMAIDLDEALIRERHTEFQHIHGSMIKINDIYKDLAEIVNEQQEGIDDIENNVTEAENKVEGGVKQLEKATSTQKSTNKYLYAIFAFMVALIIVLIIYFVVNQK